MIIHTIKGKTPVIGSDCFVAETAAVLGDVTIGDNCSLWYGAVVRGDDNSIRIGSRVSVQDCVVIHVSEGENGEVVIGDDVVLGHNATIHAAKIGNHCLVGSPEVVTRTIDEGVKSYVEWAKVYSEVLSAGE